MRLDNVSKRIILRRKNPRPQSGPQSDGAPALYVQVADWIVNHIRERKLRSGDLLPSQNELMQRFGLSQATIRHALLRLTNEGVLIAQQGKGLFVAEPRLKQSLALEGIKPKGGQSAPLAIQFVESELLTPPERILRALKLPAGSQVARVRRILSRSGQKIGLETYNIPLDVMARVSGTALKSDSLAVVFRTPATGAIGRTDCIVRSALISDFDAAFLDVQPGTLTLQQILTHYDKQDRPITAGRIVFLADQVDLQFQMSF